MRRVLLLALLAACSNPQKKLPQPVSYARAAPAAEEKQSVWEDFIDDEDRAFDVSDFLDRDIGFLPIVIPITEPAVGFGLVGAGVFFHDKKEQKKGVPPTLTAVLGGGTTNDTWLVGAAHQHIWKDGSLRYLGAAGYASINLDFYGIGSGPGDDRSTDLNFEGLFVLQEIRHEVGASKFFFGADWIYTDIDTTIQGPLGILPPYRFKNRSSGLGAFVAYDSRDNHFTPTRGIDALLGARFYGQEIGSDTNFYKLRAQFRTWFPLGDRVNLGIRLDAEGVSDGAPLYELSFVKLRGVPAFRYVDDLAVSFELEPFIKITNRWGMVVFGGVGKTAGTYSDFSGESTVWAAGAGFRYLLSRKRGIQAGIDVAYSDGDVAFYITVGNAWLR
ncbi:MAG: BamA/TamA family outer membrane protein [Planctomycetota bacterium]